MIAEKGTRHSMMSEVRTWDARAEHLRRATINICLTAQPSRVVLLSRISHCEIRQNSKPKNRPLAGKVGAGALEAWASEFRLVPTGVLDGLQRL